jgi:hypothetical protein
MRLSAPRKGNRHNGFALIHPSADRVGRQDRLRRLMKGKTESKRPKAVLNARKEKDSRGKRQKPYGALGKSLAGVRSAHGIFRFRSRAPNGRWPEKKDSKKFRRVILDLPYCIKKRQKNFNCDGVHKKLRQKKTEKF